MDRNVSERIAVVAALRCRNRRYATAAWRSFLAAPLLLLSSVALRRRRDRDRCVAGAGLALHGDWVGSLGGRLRLVVGSLVFVCAVDAGAAFTPRDPSP